MMMRAAIGRLRLGAGPRPLGTVLGLVAVVAIVAAAWQIASASRGVEVSQALAAGVPVTVYRPVGVQSAPLVVIAHGFAGSQRMMQPYAVTLARNGYLTITLDFPGHGHNADPFVSSLMSREQRRKILLAALESAIRFGLGQPVADGRLALLGHSMAGDPLARYAAAHPGRVAAMALLSPYLGADTSTEALPNLLLLYGALEPDMLHRQGLRVLAESAADTPSTGVTYGDAARGSARRMVLAPGVEHIGVLYSQEGLQQTLSWLNRALGHRGSGFVDHRAPWLGILFLGLVLLAWSLSHRLPRVSSHPLGAGLSWRRLAPVAIAPAVLTPLILWRLPSDFLPLLIGDYLVLHFALYGAMTAAGLWAVRRWAGPAGAAAPEGARIDRRGLAIAVVASSLYAVLAFAVPADRFVTTLLPDAHRWPLVFAMLAGTLIYFLADEWATRGAGAAWGGYAATKLLFVVSLLLAVALDPRRLFFLIIIVPAMLALFVLYGALSTWVYRRTWHPWIGAVANASAFASAVAVTFPIVGA